MLFHHKRFCIVNQHTVQSNKRAHTCKYGYSQKYIIKQLRDHHRYISSLCVCYSFTKYFFFFQKKWNKKKQIKSWMRGDFVWKLLYYAKSKRIMSYVHLLWSHRRIHQRPAKYFMLIIESVFLFVTLLLPLLCCRCFFFSSSSCIWLNCCSCFGICR